MRGTASDGQPDMRSWVFTRTAAANTAGSTIAVTMGASSKVSRVLLAYSGAASPTIVTNAVQAGTSASLTTPGAAVDVAKSTVVSYWADKTSGNTGWVLPPSVTSRQTSVGSGSGRITAAAGDTLTNPGAWAGAAATSTVSSSKGVAWTVVLPPSVQTNPPVASFTSACSLLTCTFDGRESTDSDGEVVNYSWNFGDGTSANGEVATRTYAAAGTYSVRLTVTDDLGATNSLAREIEVVVPTGAHTNLPPDVPERDHILISSGEILDLEYIGSRVFVAGSFTSVRNNTSTNTTSYTQRYLAAYNIDTGLLDTSFRPTINSSVQEIEASPDGSRLYAVGAFSTVNGLTRRGVVALNAVDGSVITGFTANTSARATSVDVSASTVYIGGPFTTVNGVPRVGLAAVSASTGAVDTGFVNNMSGGIGADGALTVQALILTPDRSKLLVVHTGRQIAGQDRYGVGWISTQTKQLLPWRTNLWYDNLQFVGGIQRAYAAAISPDGKFFVVGSGSGGDRPPINDTAMAFPVDGGDNVEPLWISRMFDSIYSLAITDVAVYAGGHMAFMESPTARDPWPGLTNVGYGTGQGLGGYGLGDEVVRREHIGALDPATGKALEWNPGSNSYEGNKAMLAMPRGLVTGGDATTQGGYNVGRIAFYDFASIPSPGANETTITAPIEGRIEEAGVEFLVEGTATATSGVRRVQLEVIDRDTNRYLQDNLTSWGSWNAIDVNLATADAPATTWSIGLNLPDSRRLKLLAKAFGVNGSSDATKATKKFETFSAANEPPRASITGPSGSVIPVTTFTVTGSASDDGGVTAVNVTLQDQGNRYLQDDGTVGSSFNTIRATLAVVGATSTTWSLEVTVPSEGTWTAEVTAVDDEGQGSLDAAAREWLVSATAVAPSVAVTSPAVVNPPVTTPAITVSPGFALTFSGSATDDQDLKNVEISLRNTTTRENLASDGTWGVDVLADWYRISPADIPGSSYNWTWTTPFTTVPGTYTFSVRATDNLDLSTSSTNQGRLTINVQVSGDAPPDGLLNLTGTVTGLQSLHLDLAGTATDDKGVASVRVTFRKRDTGQYIQPNGTLSAAFATREATLATPGATATTWTLPIDLPVAGDYDVVAYAFDTAGQQDTSTTGATARYPVFPGDTAPVSNEALFAPAEGGTFDQSRILTSGRFEDNQQMASVQVAIRNAAGQYLGSSGTFTSTTLSWRNAFMNSPGSLGSNFSYTSPILPSGTYVLMVRGVDQNGFATDPPVTRTVSVTSPVGNLPPVAAFTYTCASNVCTFDARSSTDENAPTLTYAWAYSGPTGSGGTSGPVPVRTFTSIGQATVTLTAMDEFGATATAQQVLTIVEPTGNVAPAAVNNVPSCVALTCNFSAVGTTDPNPGDTIAYLWTFGDGNPATSTSTSPSRVFPSAGSYLVTVRATDGWGKYSEAQRTVLVEVP